MARLRAGVGRASSATRGRRRGYAEPGLEGALPTAGTGADFGDRPRVRPTHLRNKTRKFGRKIVEFLAPGRAAALTHPFTERGNLGVPPCSEQTPYL